MSLFMQSSDKALVEQVFWFVGNSIGESEKLRDLFINSTCILDSLYNLAQSPRIGRSLMRTACWITSNIARFKNLETSQVIS